MCTATHAGVVWDRWATDPGGRSTSGASVERANRDSPWPGPALAVALAVSPAVATAGIDHAGGDTYHAAQASTKLAVYRLASDEVP